MAQVRPVVDAEEAVSRPANLSKALESDDHVELTEKASATRPAPISSRWALSTPSVNTPRIALRDSVLTSKLGSWNPVRMICAICWIGIGSFTESVRRVGTELRSWNVV